MVDIRENNWKNTANILIYTMKRNEKPKQCMLTFMAVVNAGSLVHKIN
jgi:hypothetical protein